MSQTPQPDRRWTIRSFPWILILVALAVLYIAWWSYQNEQLTPFWIVVILVILGAIAFFTDYTRCTLDLDRRTVTIHRYRVWRFSRREFSFDDLHTVATEESKSIEGTGSSFRMLFILKSGERIPFTNLSFAGRRGTQRLVEKISNYINQARPSAVQPALDGIARLQRSGVTDGIAWRSELIFNNENVPLVHWQTAEASFPGGFLLVVPAGNFQASASMPQGGLAGRVVQMAYSQYLRTLMLSERDVPGLQRAVILKDDRFTTNGALSLVTSDPAAAQNWLSPLRLQRLAAWARNNPLGSGKRTSEPHLLVNANGLRLVFQSNLRDDSLLESIARLGVSLVRE